MTRTTDDPKIALLVQESLERAVFYGDRVDGVWGPKSDLAFEQYVAHDRYLVAGSIQIKLSAAQQADLAKFLKQWKDPGSHNPYFDVEKATGLPAELIAALHWRESGGDFTTYLHNGDPLGRPTTHVPAGVMFSSWVPAAIDALSRERELSAWEMSGLEAGESNLSAMCVFAEFYNGEGYTAHGVPDPYVLAGTAAYSAGKYTEDGSYDPRAVDAQVGVLPLLRAIVV